MIQGFLSEFGKWVKAERVKALNNREKATASTPEWYICNERAKTLKDCDEKIVQLLTQENS